MQAGDEEQPAPHDRDEHGLAEIRLQNQRDDGCRQEQEGQQRARHVLRRAPSENAQAASTTKAGFTNSDGCMPSGPSMIQRCAPLISGPYWNAQQDQRPCRRNRPPSARRRRWRSDRNETASRIAQGRDEEDDLPVYEVEGREAEPLGDRRAAGHEEDEAGQHEDGERGEQQAVDRPPPIAECRAFRARHHGFKPPWLRCRARPGPARGSGLRAPRNSDIGRRTRRPATAARRRRRPAPAASAAACSHGPVERAAMDMRHRHRRASPQIRRPPRRSDRPCGPSGNSGASGSMPPSFALPPTNPVDVVEGLERLLGRIRVGGLGIVDEEHVARAADLLHAVRRDRESCAGRELDRLRSKRREPARRRRPQRHSAHCASPRSEPMPVRSATGAGTPSRHADRALSPSA